jgi:CRP-like cAMP-binding protein
MPTRLIDSLQRHGALSAADQAALAAALGPVKRFAPGEDIVTDGDRPTQCHAIVEGLAFRHRTLTDGRRQIVSFLMPGDVCDLQGLLLTLDHAVSALTHVQTVTLPHARLQELMETRPAISRGLWRAHLAEAAAFREWMLGMGRRSALARIAHFFCEVFLRMQAAGLTEKNRCRFPVTQQHLSDSLGLSTVHTNRTLQALRAEGLIAFQGGMLTVLDWPRLCAIGEFDAGYLHQASPSPLAAG